MAMALYKPGQGYWTRLMSAIGFGLLVVMGAVWLGEQLANVRIGDIQTVYIQYGVGLVVVLIFAFIGYKLLGTNPRTVEFLIATEGEMKKVNWSTKREIKGSTILVIGLTIVLALLTFSFDSIFQWIFWRMRVLET